MLYIPVQNDATAQLLQLDLHQRMYSFSILVSTTGAEYEQLYNIRVNQILSTFVFYNYSNSLIRIFRKDMQNLF